MTDITVLVPTYRRPQLLRACLDGVAALEDPGMDWEVLVIDNDPPGARRVFDEFRAHSSVPSRYVEEPTAGSAYARNRGIAEAAGDVIAMLDDDVVPEPGWLRSIVAPILAGEADGSAGTVILDPLAPRPRWFLEEKMAKYLAHFEAPDRFMKLGDYILTANAAWKAGPLRDTGGFDPALGPRKGVPMVNDDVFVANNLLERGGTIRFVPAARVVHAFPVERRRARYVLRRLYAQGRSDWILRRAEYEPRPLHGVSRAVGRFRKKLRQAREDGITKGPVAFFALSELMYTVGAIREGASWWVRRSGPGGSRTPARGAVGGVEETE